MAWVVAGSIDPFAECHAFKNAAMPCSRRTFPQPVKNTWSAIPAIDVRQPP